MDKKTKEDLAGFFGETFREVVLPELEDMKEDLDTLKRTTHRIEEELAKHDDHLDRHDKKWTTTKVE